MAGFLNFDPDEIALTRGATEALQALIAGYNKLRASETVSYGPEGQGYCTSALRTSRFGSKG